MLQRCLTEQAEVSLEIRIKLLTFETILEWYKPKLDYGKLNHKGEKLKAAMSGLMFSRNLVVGDSNIKQEF